MLVNQILKSWEGLLERNWCGDESPRDRKLRIFLENKLKIAWCLSYSQWTACHFLSFFRFGFWFKWQRRPYWESDGNTFLLYNMVKELWYVLARCKYQDLRGLFSKDHDQVDSWQSTVHNCTGINKFLE